MTTADKADAEEEEAKGQVAKMRRRREVRRKRMKRRGWRRQKAGDVDAGAPNLLNVPNRVVSNLDSSRLFCWADQTQRSRLS